MKKFLAVATALVLAISSLCVFVVADTTTVEVNGTTYEVLFSEDCTFASGGWSTYTVSSSSSFLSALQTEGALVLLTRDAEPTIGDGDYEKFAFVDSWWSQGSALYADTGYYTEDGVGLNYTFDVDLVVAYDAATIYSYISGGGSAQIISNTSETYNVTNVSVVVEATSDEDDEEEETTTTTTYTSANGLTVTNYWSTSVSGTTVTYDGSQWAEAYVNVPNLSDAETLTITVSGVSGSVQIKLYYADGTNGYVELPSDGTYTVTLSSALSQFTLQDSAGSSSTTITVDSVTLTVASEDDDDDDDGETVSGVTGTIYINEEYHGMFIVRNGKKFMISIPHTVGDDGYCTVCHEYIGTDGDVATTDINGGEYVVAYTSDINLSSGSWASKDLGDTSILDALATEGAILVVTRDSEQNIVFSSEETIYEKFVLVNSWYSGDTVQLGTAGHTSADEADAAIIDCISDDGTVAMYDGNAIYDAWVANGLNAGGTVLFISNTSSTDYKIANITVYVPAGSTTVEDVDVTEPAEPTDTETEDDGTDDVEVTENDTTADTNPTTGVVLALVPMAIAGFAAVASKRK